MKKLLLLLLPLLLLLGCEKEQECERLQFGSICITNSTSKVVYLSIDSGSQVELSTGNVHCRDLVSVGVHSYEATTGGLFPDTWSETVDIIACEAYEGKLIL